MNWDGVDSYWNSEVSVLPRLEKQLRVTGDAVRQDPSSASSFDAQAARPRAPAWEELGLQSSVLDLRPDSLQRPARSLCRSEEATSSLRPSPLSVFADVLVVAGMADVQCATAPFGAAGFLPKAPAAQCPHMILCLWHPTHDPVPLASLVLPVGVCAPGGSRVSFGVGSASHIPSTIGVDGAGRRGERCFACVGHQVFACGGRLSFAVQIQNGIGALLRSVVRIADLQRGSRDRRR
jgi:hypothetical protein